MFTLYSKRKLITPVDAKAYGVGGEYLVPSSEEVAQRVGNAPDSRLLCAWRAIRDQPLLERTVFGTGHGDHVTQMTCFLGGAGIRALARRLFNARRREGPVVFWVTIPSVWSPFLARTTSPDRKPSPASGSSSGSGAKSQPRAKPLMSSCADGVEISKIAD
ncbi:hypothetical protein [Streptomyces sp. NPDC012510]|uniref:hypothetical protein n=1 Tax=Streptomyces sp. NPDC012510 TaxID=3364838 RepID=UPI0036E2DA82